MDISKAFDTINHDFSGFSDKLLNFMLSYLKNRSQRVNGNNFFSTCEEIRAGARFCTWAFIV